MNNKYEDNLDSKEIVDVALNRMREGTVIEEKKKENGKLILVIGLFLSLVILAITFNSKYQDPRLTIDRKTVSLLQHADGHYYVKGEINGNEVNFVVDTGATTIAIPLRLADSLGLLKGELVEAGTANGIVKGNKTKLNSVSIGTITKQSVHAVLLPNMPSDELLLGMSFLRNMTIVQKDNVLEISEN